MNRIDAALKMARMGWPVFPLVPGGRLPYAGEGVSVATCNPAKIRAWFAKRPTMNYGVCTTGGVVIDIDEKGDKTGLANFRREFGDIPETFTVQTPNGGLHLYFQHEGCGQSPLCEHVDVRSFNGYVVGPGSSVKAGVYEASRWQPAADAPEAIRRRLAAVPKRLLDDRAERQAPIGELDTDRALEAGRRYLEVDAPAGVHGGRNETGYRVACVLKDLGLSAEAIAELMVEHWDCDLGDDFSLEDIAELGRRAHLSGQNRPGAASIEADFGDLDLGDDFDALLAEAVADRDQEGAEADQAGNGGPVDALAELRAVAHTWAEPFDPHKAPEAMPPRRWYVKDVLMPGHLAGLVAAPGAGKSTLALTIMAGLAAGDLSALGLEVAEGAKRCLFLSTEEDRNETEKRAWAACEALGIDRDAIGDRLVLPSKGFDGLRLLKREGQGLVVDVDAQRLAVLCHDLKIDVLVLDPWVEMSDAEENSNPDVKQAVTLVRDLCRRRGMAGLVIHHSRKSSHGSDAAGDMNTARGGGALAGAVRALYTLVRPAPDELAVYGVEEARAERIVRLDRAKGSYSAPGKATTWFEVESLAKPNGDGTAEELPAFKAFDMAGQMTAARARIADMLGAALVLEEGERPQISFKDAMAILGTDETFGRATPAKIKAMAESLFAKTPALTAAGAISLVTYGTHRAFVLDRDAGLGDCLN